MRPEAAGVGLPDRMNGMKSPECSDTMKITILGPAHPYRGGLASIMEIMARTFQRRGDEVDIKTFTLQYPSLLFPGESQTVATPPPADLRICRCVNTMNPLNWVRVGRRIRRERPDFVLMKYWTPFMAPCFGTIARIARGNGHTKVLCQIDNVEPHEHHLTDKPFNRYYLHSVDGFVYMSEQVHSELRAYSDAPALFSPHPLFENFGERVERSEACVRLGLDPANRYVLFFGLIRDYKGLDLLLDAWAQLRRAGRTEGRRLIVAGEFYTAREPYLNRIADNGLQDEVLLHDRFIPDDDVKYYFSAADFVVQPYKTATQSGVTQIAYQFCVPMVVTAVGGLPEIVPDGRVGYVCPPTAEGVAAAMDRMYEGDALKRFRENCVEERRRFSWEEMCSRVTELYGLVAPK
jgi:glycosyltransferase involved in cell wall biosynthesis